MASRYKKLAEFNDVLYTMDSPVVVEKMVHNFDSMYGVNVLQIHFRNVSGGALYGLSLGLDLYNHMGKKFKSIEFNYYAMEVAHGKTFGGTEDIMVEPEAVRFEINVLGADLEGGVRFHDKLSLDKTPNPVPVSIYAGEFEKLYIERFEKTWPKARLVCAPEKRPDFWRCTCGRIWPHDAPKCTICKIKASENFALLPAIKKEEKEKADKARMEKEEAAFRAEEEARAIEEAHAREEKKRKEAAERAKQEAELNAMEEKAAAEAAEKKKKQRRKAYIAAISAAAVLCLFMFYIVPEVQSYHQRRNELAATDSAIQPEDKSGGEQADKQGEGEQKKASYEIPFMVMGDGIDNTNSELMWRLLGNSLEGVTDYEKMDVTTNEGHIYMDGVIGRDNVEASAVSGVIVCPETEGGINIDMFNIGYYTEKDFREQIESMGIDNANVVVAAPTRSSGSTAMLGLLKFAGRTKGTEGKEIGVAVAKHNMNIRTGNSIRENRIATVPVGTELKVLDITENSWYKILWPSAENGYAFTSNTGGEYYDFTFTK